jgi:hypothetical protein
MNKKIFSFVLAGAITVSSMFACFANTNTSGQQNDPYFGLPYVPDQLGEYTNDGFLYKSEPFTDLYAIDKGLIPTSKKSTYKSPSTWAKDEVLEASKMNLNNMEIITGYQGDITRAEFAKLMVQAYFKYAPQFVDAGKTLYEDIPVDWEDDIFNDISGIANKDYITWAYYLNITNGTAEGKFSPNSKITRQEMATMLYRYICIFDLSIKSITVAKNFDDDAQIAGWAKKEVRAIANREIILGFPGNLFKPLDNSTREQSLLLDLRTNKTFVDTQVTNELAAPANVKISNTKLYWNAVDNAQTYNIYQRKYLTPTDYEDTYYAKTNTTVLDLSELNKQSGKYEFYVVAFNEFNCSPNSAVATCVVPKAVEESTINSIGANITWTAVPDATSYKVKIVGTDVGNTYSQEIIVNAPTVTVSKSGIPTSLPLKNYKVSITAYAAYDFYSATSSDTFTK